MAPSGAYPSHPAPVALPASFLFTKRVLSPSMWCDSGVCTFSFPPNRSWLRKRKAEPSVSWFDREKPRIDLEEFPFIPDRLERRTETRNVREAFGSTSGSRRSFPFQIVDSIGSDSGTCRQTSRTWDGRAACPSRVQADGHVKLSHPRRNRGKRIEPRCAPPISHASAFPAQLEFLLSSPTRTTFDSVDPGLSRSDSGLFPLPIGT